MPNITEKEMIAIKEQLELEMIMTKKYKVYAQTCDDPQLKTKFEQIASRHKKHFTSLQDILNSQ